jgi:hypothetical protein
MVELMVATSLGTIIMAAVMSTFLFIGRTSIVMRNYADLETQARNAMEIFAQDVRMSSAVSWTNANSVSMTVRSGGVSQPVQYAYDASSRTFSRTFDGTTTMLISNIRNFAFSAYSIDTEPLSLAAPTAATNTATKQIQIALETERRNPVLALTTNKVISARFVLRNKRVTA